MIKTNLKSTIKLQKYKSADLTTTQGNLNAKHGTPKVTGFNYILNQEKQRSTKNATGRSYIEIEHFKASTKNPQLSSNNAFRYDSNLYASYKNTKGKLLRSPSQNSLKIKETYGLKPELDKHGRDKPDKDNRPLSTKNSAKSSMGKFNFYSNKDQTKITSAKSNPKINLDELVFQRTRKNRGSLSSIKSYALLDKYDNHSNTKQVIKEKKRKTSANKNNIDVYNSAIKPLMGDASTKYISHDKKKSTVNYTSQSKNLSKADLKKVLAPSKSIAYSSYKFDFGTKFKKKNKQNRSEQTEYSFSHRSHKGYSYFDVTKKNQDAYFIVEKLLGFSRMHLIGVCDGHGQEGDKISAFVKENFPLLFEEALRVRIEQKNGHVNENELYKNNQYEIEIFEALKNTVNKLFSSELNVYFSGTTFNCIFVFGPNIVICNVGDSRAILSSSNNFKDITKLSRDHKPTDPQEKARLLKRNARIEQSKNEEGEAYGPMRVWLQNEDQPGLAMTRSIGDIVGAQIGITWKPYVVYKQLPSNEEHIIVIGTDGLWDVLSNSEVMTIIKKHWTSRGIEKASNELLQEAVKRWSNSQDVLRDDITFIIGFIHK